MTHIALTDREAVLTAVAGRRIPRRAWADTSEMSRLLFEAGNIVRDAERRADAVIERARDEGYAQGLAQAQSLMAQHLLDAQRQAHEFLEASQQRIVALAVAIVERIAPALGEPQVVAALVEEALSTLQAEKYLRIRVTAQAADATQEMLEYWRSEHPQVETAQILVDPHLAPFTCVVESELGRIEAGLAAQLDAIRAKLMAVAQGTRR
ncbi:MAG TPA: FliH/SctL family protein [Steroidobacteraceae bacterium]